MKNRFWKLAFVVVLAAGFAYAQYGSSQSQTQSTPPTSGQAGQSQQQPPSGMSPAATDPQSQIQQAFQQDPSLSGVSVSVKEDKIELSGNVASKADRDKARSVAESNAGGKKVVDHIKVSGSSTSPSSNPPPQ